MIDESSMQCHLASKQHRKRYKVCLTEEPYTIEEAERAGGLKAAANAKPIKSTVFVEKMVWPAKKWFF